MKLSKDLLIAYDAFLWSEEIRHQQDIELIQKKRKVLHECGYSASEVGPWITEEEVKKFVEEVLSDEPQ